MNKIKINKKKKKKKKNFKNLLVRNHRNFNIIWKDVPLVILYQDCSSQDDSSKNIAARDRAYFPYIAM